MKGTLERTDGGRAAFYVHRRLVCQVLVSRGLYACPTIRYYDFLKSHSQLTFPKCHV